jgi:dolichyl-phosphate beta-glucosyltransferase
LLISIVIPCYNEENRIIQSLDLILEFIKSSKYNIQIIMVNNKSTDNTLNILKRYKKKINNYKIISANEFKGKGYAVKKGVLNSDGDIIIFTDADLSTPIEEIEKIIFEINNGAEVVIGSRQNKKSKVLKRQRILRESMGKIFNKILQLILFTGFKDTQCGFKGFTKKSAQKIFNTTIINGFAFDAEILFIAKNIFNFNIVEVPVVWINSEESKVNIISDSLIMLKDLIRIRMKYKYLLNK